MNPNSSAAATGMLTMKRPADGVPVSATELGGIATAAVAGVEITGEPLSTPPTGLIGWVLTALEAVGTVAGVVATAETAAGEATGEAVLTGDPLAGGVLAAEVGALTVPVSAAVGSTVMAGLVAASAVAVRVTDVTDVAPEAIGICACIWYDDGDTAVASDPIVQEADPSPLGQRPVNAGSSPCGVPVSATDTPDTGPFSAQTSTVYDAAWPRVTLDWEFWTLTHSNTAGAVGEGVVAAGSGSQLELAAASAAPEVPTAIAAHTAIAAAPVATRAADRSVMCTAVARIPRLPASPAPAEHTAQHVSRRSAMNWCVCSPEGRSTCGPSPASSPCSYRRYGLVTLAVGSSPLCGTPVQASRRGDHRRAGARKESATKGSSRVYAIVRCGGRQEKVALDDVVTVDKLPGEAGSTVTLPALLVVDGERVISDPAEVGRYQVTADIIGDAAGPKINMIHYRNKTGYRRRLGHRQKYTQVRITGIGTESPQAKAQPKPRSRAKAQPKAEED